MIWFGSGSSSCGLTSSSPSRIRAENTPQCEVCGAKRVSASLFPAAAALDSSMVGPFFGTYGWTEVSRSSADPAPAITSQYLICRSRLCAKLPETEVGRMGSDSAQPCEFQYPAPSDTILLGAMLGKLRLTINRKKGRSPGPNNASDHAEPDRRG